MEFNMNWFDTLPSTNSYLADLYKTDNNLPSGYVVATREQTSGRGRFDRAWKSGKDTSLCFSILIKNNVDINSIASLPMVFALAGNKFLRSNNIKSICKWPNDILCGNKKICGILSEKVSSNSNENICIVGMGLNVNIANKELSSIERPATSMLNESGKKYNIDDVLDGILECIPEYYIKWKENGFTGIRENFEENTYQAGTEILVTNSKQEKVSGTLAGFGKNGELFLRHKDSSIETIWAGEISVEHV
jgi:BirA family biotin operon repressor/biotin-[acetyl-CoA-carboxylase] ligase